MLSFALRSQKIIHFKITGTVRTSVSEMSSTRTLRSRGWVSVQAATTCGNSSAKSKKPTPVSKAVPNTVGHSKASAKGVSCGENSRAEAAVDTKTKKVLTSNQPKTQHPRKRKPPESVGGTDKAIKLETNGSALQDIESIAWQPANWREVMDNILKMRKMHVAPVDSLGCEECPEKDAQPEVFRYQTLISVMLSSQTKDEVTYAATQRLIAHGLNVDAILATPDEKIGELIYPAGFWKSKVKFIRKTTQILKDEYNGDIPRTFKELCKLPGVGPKMANIVMSVAWNETVGIAVDTHVHRISNRLGWVPKPTKEPEKTRKALESWLPKNLWQSASLDLVGFGQTICKPLKPKCGECLNNYLCPSSSFKAK